MTRETSVSTCILVGSAVAQCAEPIKAAGLSLQLTAALLHILGGIVAYFGCKPLGYDEQTCRTFAIETSMKSSAFGFLLAKLHFSQFLVRSSSLSCTLVELRAHMSEMRSVLLDCLI